MRIDLFLASLLVVISALIWVGALAIGIMLIVRGTRRRIREAKVKGWLMIIAGGILGSLMFWPSMGYMYIERLWFKQMGYTSVFWRMTNTPWALFLKYGLIAAGFLTANFILAQRLCPIPGGFQRWATGKTGSVYRTMILVIILISIVMGSVLVPMWDDFLRHYEREPFWDRGTGGQEDSASNALLSGKSGNYGRDEVVRDPQFGKDVSYFLFTLPVRNFVSLWTKALFWITLLCMGILYNFYRHRDAQSRANVARRGIFHLSGLWILVLIASIWRSVMNTHRLVYSQRGTVFGAGYTDVHVQIPAYRIYIAIVILVALAVAINVRWRKRFLVTIPIVLWSVSYIVLIWIVPAVYQYIKVSPNESIRERDFISRNIEYTRMGYGLHGVKTSVLDPGVATLEKVKSQPGTLKNVQLWDRRAVRDTLSQIQVFRPYYIFWDVDADRYHLTDPSTGDADYRQVMIAARELDSEKLPSRTWVTLRLIYTHGYGVCLGPVNQFTDEGLPYLWVKGIPPEIFYPGVTDPIIPELNITRPEIYYGEATRDYVFAKTEQQEFDHPEMKGPDEVEDHYITYEGSGGVPLKSIFRRCMLALRFWDFRIITSEHLRPDSRIMFNRQVADRSRRIAPFLFYDKDPYIVIGDSGRLWWVIDAYVISKHYPYSEPYHSTFGTINYIRNPLKAVIDAYNGQVDFYIWNENEVINKVYRKIFPGLFKSRKDMPDGLDRHNRYPDDLTTIQAEKYCGYHMQDPQTFYARGDQWDLPYEVYYQSGKEPMVPMVPLYVMIRLPNDEKEEFVSIIPFTPYPTRQYEPGQNPRPNMVAWMTVRNDEPGYGEIMVYTFPKGETIPGPAQIEARIGTNPEISASLTLWDARGSQVIRGNLLTIPVGDSLFYVEPLYIQEETIRMPLLKQVIVAAGDQVALAENFDMAIEKVFSVGEKIEMPAEAVAEEGAPNWKPRSLVDIISSARENFSRYKSQMESDNADEAAQTLEELGKNLDELERYKELLGRKQADILEDLIKSLNE
jgi:uncharacterized membrane protein (UPF0182 family)